MISGSGLGRSTLSSGTAGTHAGRMSSGAIARVFCVDGPCQGVQYVNLDTGRVLFSDQPDCAYSVYRISPAEITSNVAGSFPAAYFDRYDQPPA